MADSLVVIRSGATEYDLHGRIRGRLSIPLPAAGIAETHAAADLLAVSLPTALYTSTAACALHASRIIGQATRLAPRRLNGLENLDQGLWEGMLVADIRRRQPRLYRQWQENPWAVSPPDGELLDDACDRVATALERLLRRHAAGRIALIVPEPLDRIVCWLLAGMPLGDLWSRETRRLGLVEIPLHKQWISERLAGAV